MINLELINHGDKEEQTIEIKSIVCKPVERLQYSQHVDDRSIAISYVDSKEVNSEDHLEINDYSWRVRQNNSNFLEEHKEFVIAFDSFSTSYRDLLITNISEKDINGEETPLYYKHFRKVKEASIHFIENGEELNLNSGFKIIDNCIYTNYENVFNEKNYNYKVFFIEGVDLEGNSFNELLNIIPAIDEASWEKIDLDTGMFNEVVYSREVVGDKYFYEIVNPISKCGERGYSVNYFVKVKEDNLIKLKKPYQYSLKNPWFLEVSNGFVFDSGKRYFVPEYRDQPFEIESGLLRLVNKEAYYITSNLVKLPANPVKINPEENINVSFIIRNDSETIIKALTTDITLINTKVSDTDVIYEDGIESWDNYSGIVELKDLIDPSYVIEATFFYKTNNLVLNNLNVNFYSNKDLVENNAFFYLIPNQQEKSIYFFLVDEEDRIIKTSNPKFDVFYEGSYNQENMIGKQLRYFMENYCAGWSNSNLYMPLGKVSIVEDFYLDEVNEVEIKQKTYLNESKIEDYFRRQHKGLQSKFGYGEEGQTIQKNNLVYVKYPITLLSQYGGEYTEDQLVDLSKRKLPPEVDIVVDYDYMKSELSFTQDESSITVSFSWEGPGKYILEKSINEFGEKSILYEVESASEESLSFVDENVDANKTYWYWVRIDNNPPSRTYGVYKS